jgi:hypothetical protein
VKQPGQRQATEKERKPQIMQSYDTIDLRMSIVYRARCFHDASERAKFYAQNVDDRIQLSDILDTFKRDMVTRRVITQKQLDSKSTLDLALLIMDTYIKYPLPALEQTWVPVNYCALPRMVKWTAPLFNWICS